jgi:tetratricopeptide (TPR) repeat protein
MTGPSLLDRLKRSRLVQALILYLGASWVVIEVAGELQDALELPSWVTPVAFVLLLVGLLVVLATAWVQSHPLVDAREAAGEVPESWEVGFGDLVGAIRRGRLPHLTWGRAVVGGVFALSLLFGFAGLFVLLRNRTAVGEPAALSAEEAGAGLAIVPFAVSGVDSVYREGLVTLLATTLDGAAGLRAVDSRTVLARWDAVAAGGDRPDLAAILNVAASVGARFALVGSAVATGGDVRLAGELYDVASGEKLGTARAEGPADSLMAVVDGLSLETARILLAQGGAGPELQHLSSLTTTSLDALVAYIEGERLYRRGDFDAALEAYERAIERDSSFALAHLRAYQSFGWIDVFDPARLPFQEASSAAAERLPARERALVAALVGVDADDPSAFEGAEQATRRYPDDPDLWNALGELQVHVGQRALRPYEEQREPLERAVELAPDFAPYLIHLTEYHLSSGDSAEAARLVERERELAPEAGFAARHAIAFELIHGDAAPSDAELTEAGFNILTSTADLGRLDARETFLRAMAPRFADRPEAEGIAQLLRVTVVNQGRIADALREFPKDAGLRVRAFDMGLLPADSLRSYDFADDPVAHAVASAMLGDWETYRGLLPAVERQLQRSAEEVPEAVARRVRALPRMIAALAAWKREGPAAGRPLMEEALLEVSDPAVEPAVWWLGQMHEESGDDAEALRHYRAIAHNDAFAALRAARIADRLGQPELARRYYRELLAAWEDADPEFQPWIEEARGWLERLRG